MGTGREKRPSEKTVDTLYTILRSLDIKLWTGDKYWVQDIEEDVDLAKHYLDELVKQFKTEMGLIKPPTNPPTTQIDPKFQKKEWQVTPIIVPKSE